MVNQIAVFRVCLLKSSKWQQISEYNVRFCTHINESPGFVLKLIDISLLENVKTVIIQICADVESGHERGTNL